MMMQRLILAIVWFACATLSLPTPAQAADSPTDLVLEVDKGPLTIYDKPSKQSGTVIQSLPFGGRFKWSGAMQQAEDLNWMAVSAPGVTGWAAPENEAVFPIDPTKITLNMDRSAVFKVVTTDLNLWQAPDFQGGLVAAAPIGAQLTVTDGPVRGDLYTWWQAKTADGKIGWFADNASTLEVIQPLKVYAYNVCDNFDLKDFGVAGWDSIRQDLPTLIPSNEKIQCLASTNFKGDNSPVVVIWTHIEASQGPHDTLRIFDNAGGLWTKIHEQSTEDYQRLERISLHDFEGQGKPSLLWMARMDGTGGVLTVNVLHYTPTTGVQRVLDAGGYKGGVQVGKTSVVVIEADYKEGEPNCCPSGLHRMGYVWQGSQFVQAVDDKFPQPYFFQGLKGN
jgi:hypothetical protein